MELKEEGEGEKHVPPEQGPSLPLLQAAGCQAGLAQADQAELREGVILTSPSEGVWTGQPLGTSCNNLAL